MKCARCHCPHPTEWRRDFDGWSLLCGICADEYDREFRGWAKVGCVVTLVILFLIAWLA